ncbi:type II toxin-antitoxin system PemK/MazF family toxin [Spirulina sp. CS-785/01]|uniref:type II toxin-antitoxin system PemK/MazF family toxin n=1 Tax=Spirulina sp. CS-785/01 TaxID=3021716 RepID=UPI00232E113A|nr:type II toxin-antitoxin system PemK/MazF family toxin [Spirulina sp. CS-785/01]MDB9311693.1 type II toxin-antitoxin system PemK/MazF family toxin [Spirulina sp. CS-785/01]
MAGQRPRQGWIYKINPYRVSLRCRSGHQYFYDLSEPRELTCQHSGCNLVINSSRVFWGDHPYIIWENNKFQDEENYIETFTAIPLTSKTTYAGLSTAYPITKTARNGLEKTSYALVHQICTVDGTCFKDSQGDWLVRIGQLSKDDKLKIEETLIYYLNINREPTEDWFRENASPKLLKKVFDLLPEDDREGDLKNLLDDF